MAHLGERINLIRTKKGIKRTFVAEKLGYKSPTSLYDVESGRTKLPAEKIPILLDVLGVTYEELFFDQNIRKSRTINEISING